MSDVISNIEGGLTEDQLQTISDISTAINNDPNFFFTNIQIQINNKQNSLNNNLPSPITNIILYNNNYIRTIRCRAGVTSFLETDPGSDNYNNYEINIDTHLNNLQNYYLKSYIDSIISRGGNFNFVKIPTHGAINMLNSAGTDAVMAIGDTEIINYRPTKLREVKLYNSSGSSVLQQVDNLGITNMAFTYFNTDILINGIADINTLAGPCLTQINNQISTTSYLKSDVYTKTETLALNTLTNYNTNATTTSRLTDYYNNTETLALNRLTNYNTKTTTTSRLTDYYNKTETLALNNLTNYHTKTTTTRILTDYYNKTETLALNNLTNYNTKATTTTSILTNYYNKTETLNISTFSNYYTKATANSLLSQTQDTLSSYGVNGIPIFMNPTQLSNIMGGNNITVGRHFPDGEIIISSDVVIDNDITSLTNYYTKTDTTNSYQEKILDNGGNGQTLFQFTTGGIVPKNTLSRIFGEAPISVNKYSDIFNPAKNGNIGISINLNQDSTILYATSLSLI